MKKTSHSLIKMNHLKTYITSQRTLTIKSPICTYTATNFAWEIRLIELTLMYRNRHFFVTTIFHLVSCSCVKTRPERREANTCSCSTDTRGEATTYKVSSFSLLPQREGKKKQLERLVNSPPAPTQPCIQAPISDCRAILLMRRQG